MKRWTEYLLPVALLITVAIGVYAYFKIVEQKDYLTMVYPWCDTTIESCFAYCEEEECEEVEPYKKVLIETDRLALCIDEDCEALMCEPGDPGCITYHCAEDMLEEGEYCLAIEDATANEEEETVGNETELNESSESTSEEATEE